MSLTRPLAYAPGAALGGSFYLHPASGQDLVKAATHWVLVDLHTEVRTGATRVSVLRVWLARVYGAPPPGYLHKGVLG